MFYDAKIKQECEKTRGRIGCILIYYTSRRWMYPKGCVRKGRLHKFSFLDESLLCELWAHFDVSRIKRNFTSSLVCSSWLSTLNFSTLKKTTYKKMITFVTLKHDCSVSSAFSHCMVRIKIFDIRILSFSILSLWFQLRCEIQN
jgi:hypothetical protein